MRMFLRSWFLPAALIGGVSCLLAARPALADEPAAESTSTPAEEGPAVGRVAGGRGGEVAGAAEGPGDGRVTLSVTSRSNRQLRVGVPRGLVAGGAGGGGGGGGMGGGGGGMMG